MKGDAEESDKRGNLHQACSSCFEEWLRRIGTPWPQDLWQPSRLWFKVEIS
jgi:hypothetical protein